MSCGTDRHLEQLLTVNRRHFFRSGAIGVGAMALTSLLHGRVVADKPRLASHHRPLAKRIIYLFQSGGPAQQDLYVNSCHQRFAAISG
jgi:hypothetical protein